MDKDIAISVKNISKTFKIPHEKVTSVRGAVVSAFKSGRYEEFKALDDVSFEVKKGEFFGIIGRNGSGKSTLLKILAGIYQADKGKVQINGMISPFLELGIGFNPELSGRDNVYLNATVLGLSKKEIDAKFDDIVRFSELERFIDQKLKNYSSGMQVRLAFSVSIHANRDILLMDEVLAVGDSNFQSKCIEEFERYKLSGKTVILVSHDIETIREYCDRVILLKNGKIIKIGSSADVVRAYINENVKEVDKKIGEATKDKTISEDAKKEEIKSGERENRKIEIEGFEINDENGNVVKSLESGKKFKIKLFVKFLTDVKNPVFGIMFKNNTGENLFGIHSLYSRNPLVIDKIAKDSKIEVIFNAEMILNSGVYNFCIACASQETHLKYEILDIKDDVAKIQVFSDRIFWSKINSNSKVEIKILA